MVFTLQERESVERQWKDDLEATIVRAKGKPLSLVTSKGATAPPSMATRYPPSSNATN